VKTTKVTHHFLISPSCLNHLESTLKSVTDFTTNFFNNSSWDSYWNVAYRNGRETSRKLFYSIGLKTKDVAQCGCTLAPYLTDTLIKVIDASHGAASVTHP
jgi:hypothetical protein